MYIYTVLYNNNNVPRLIWCFKKIEPALPSISNGDCIVRHL